MIFWISLIIVILCIFFIKKWWNVYGNSNLKECLIVFSIAFVSMWILIHIVIGSANLIYKTKMYQDQLTIKYEQLEANKNNKFIINDIINWNSDIKFNQKYQKNFWIGPYIPNIYDNYKTIEIE